MENETIFRLSPSQVKDFKDWSKDKVIPSTAIGGAYTVCFTPTSIGDFVEVRCVDGTVLNLTDYDEL